MTKQNESYGASEDLVVEITAIQPRLYGFILKRIADHEQALEVLQNTNLGLCRKAGEFQNGSSPDISPEGGIRARWQGVKCLPRGAAVPRQDGICRQGSRLLA